MNITVSHKIFYSATISLSGHTCYIGNYSADALERQDLLNLTVIAAAQSPSSQLLNRADALQVVPS